MPQVRAFLMEGCALISTAEAERRQFVAEAERLSLSIRLDSLVDVEPGSFSATTLLLTLSRGDTTLATEWFDAAGSFTREFDLLSGATYSLDLLLSSEASITAGGTAFSTGMLEFDAAAVPSRRRRCCWRWAPLASAAAAGAPRRIAGSGSTRRSCR